MFTTRSLISDATVVRFQLTRNRVAKNSLLGAVSSKNTLTCSFSIVAGDGWILRKHNELFDFQSAQGLTPTGIVGLQMS